MEYFISHTVLFWFGFVLVPVVIYAPTHAGRPAAISGLQRGGGELLPARMHSEESHYSRMNNINSRLDSAPARLLHVIFRFCFWIFSLFVVTISQLS